MRGGNDEDANFKAFYKTTTIGFPEKFVKLRFKSGKTILTLY